MKCEKCGHYIKGTAPKAESPHIERNLAWYLRVCNGERRTAIAKECGVSNTTVVKAVEKVEKQYRFLEIRRNARLFCEQTSYLKDHDPKFEYSAEFMQLLPARMQ